jgi:DNA-binding transcriptional MerR regulator
MPSQKATKASKSMITPEMEMVGGWTVDQLAENAGTTVRNLRAFQDRGILPPPEKHGRMAVYGERHLQRLSLILRLQQRGYSLGSIGELIGAAEDGRAVRDLIGLDAAIAAPLGSECPAMITRDQIRHLFGLPRLPKRELERAVALKFLQPEGNHYRVGNIRLLEAAGDLVKAGIKLSDLIDIAERLRGHMQRTADDVIFRLAAVIDSYGTRIPPAEDIPRIVELINMLRRIVDNVLLAEAHRAIERSVAELYGDRLARTVHAVTK